MSTATGATATRSTSARSPGWCHDDAHAQWSRADVTIGGHRPNNRRGSRLSFPAPRTVERRPGWRRGSSKASTIPTRRRWESKSAASSERSIPTRVIAVSLYAASPPSSRQTIGLVSSGSTCGWRPAASLAAGGALVWSFQARRGSRSPRPRPDASYRSGAPAPQPQCGRACGNKFRVKQPPPKQTAKPPDG